MINALLIRSRDAAKGHSISREDCDRNNAVLVIHSRNAYILIYLFMISKNSSVSEHDNETLENKIAFTDLLYIMTDA